MYKIRIVLFSGLLFILGGCTGSEYKLAQTKKTITTQEVSDRSIEYRILSQDRLEITLYKDPSQSSEGGMVNELGQSMKKEGILVNASGYITLPLIGKIKVAGLTQSEAATLLTSHFSKYLNTPTVYLEVLNKRLFVLGEVKNPGIIKIDKEKMTLFEAIAFAGDLTDSAVRDNIIILSNSNTKGLQMRTVNLTNFDTMNYASLMLRPNDIVYVQPDSWKEFKVVSDNLTSPFATIAEVAQPFVTLKYLTD